MERSLSACVEYDIFVPTVNMEGTLYTAEDTLQLRGELVEFFGGLTDTRHRNEGLWKVGGVTVRDEIILWRVVSDRGEAGDRFIQKIKKNLEKSLKQDQVLIIRRQIEVI